MNFFKKSFVAVLLCILIVLVSTTISISTKLNNKCEQVIDTFYEGKMQNGFVVNSIYGNIVKMYEYAENILVVADNYGVNTKELAVSISELKETVSYTNHNVGEIFEAYNTFYNKLWAVELELSEIQLSQRHLEYMRAASEEINNLKLAIDNSDYNNNVKTFYKKFDRFPVNAFADIFDIEYPEYFA